MSFLSRKGAVGGTDRVRSSVTRANVGYWDFYIMFSVEYDVGRDLRGLLRRGRSTLDYGPFDDRQKKNHEAVGIVVAEYRPVCKIKMTGLKMKRKVDRVLVEIREDLDPRKGRADDVVPPDRHSLGHQTLLIGRVTDLIKRSALRAVFTFLVAWRSHNERTINQQLHGATSQGNGGGSSKDYGTGRFHGRTEQQADRLTAHTGEVLSVPFSPEEQMSMSRSSDGPLRLWDMHVDERSMRWVIDGSHVENWTISLFSAIALDGRRIVVATEDDPSKYRRRQRGSMTLPPVLGPNGETLFWIVPDCLSTLREPRNTWVLGARTLELNFSRLAYGTSWTYRHD
ncbi:hypothetical protein BDW22DRAFT_1345430 [Trametopsis cervina]|nr:hypothetical protein BDW22DRAFT_1345430 [Trametopsis cervina]